MTKSFTLAALGLAALALSVSTAREAAQAAPRAPRPSVAIGAARFTPKKLTAQGGNIEILRVPVTPRGGATVNAVRAYTEFVSGGGAGSKSTLSSVLPKVYRGAVAVPGNTKTTKVTVNVVIEADTSLGILKKNVGRITMDAFKGDPNSPPPPPPI